MQHAAVHVFVPYKVMYLGISWCHDTVVDAQNYDGYVLDLMTPSSRYYSL